MFQDYRKIINYLTLFFIITSWILSYFFRESVNGDVFCFVCIPVFLGALFQDIYLRASQSIIFIKLLLFSFFIFLIACFIFWANVMWLFDPRGLLAVIALWVPVFLSLSFFVWNKERYIGIFSFSHYFILSSLFFSWVSIAFVWIYVPFENKSIIHLFTFMLLYFLSFLSVLIAIWKTKKLIFIWHLIIWTLISLLLWLSYVFTPILNIAMQWDFSSRYFLDFLLVWFSTWLILQNIFILGEYFKWWRIKQANKKLLERMPRKIPSTFVLLLLALVVLVYFLMLNSYMLDIIELPSSPKVFDLLVIAFIWIELMDMCLKFILKEKYFIEK